VSDQTKTNKAMKDEYKDNKAKKLKPKLFKKMWLDKLF
jgi:hypothetical protein